MEILIILLLILVLNTLLYDRDLLRLISHVARLFCSNVCENLASYITNEMLNRSNLISLKLMSHVQLIASRVVGCCCFKM